MFFQEESQVKPIDSTLYDVLNAAMAGQHSLPSEQFVACTIAEQDVRKLVSYMSCAEKLQANHRAMERPPANA